MRGLFLCPLLIVTAATLCVSQNTNFPDGPQYLLTGSPLLARPIATPSMALKDPPLEVGAHNATAILIAGAGNQTVLPPQAVDLPPINLAPVYYEIPQSTFEISSEEPSSELSSAQASAGILEMGDSRETTVESLRERGYGINLGMFALFEKAHMRHATHVYTNADIDRLPGGR